MSTEFRAPTLDDLPALAAFFAELRDRYGAHVPTEGKLRDDLTRPGDNVGENYRIELEDGSVTGWASVWSPEAQTDRAFIGVRTLPRDGPFVRPPARLGREARGREVGRRSRQRPCAGGRR